MSERMETLLCWHSKNHGIEVLDQTISRLHAACFPVGHVLYLVQSDMEVRVPESMHGARIECLEMPISDPTRHKQIYDSLKDRVLPKLEDLNGGLHINISPGTPAMHAVWLVLHAGGMFPDGTKLWSSQFDVVRQVYSINDVDFLISTYLSEIKKFSRAYPGRSEYEVEAKSVARRKMLEDLKRYALVRGEPLLILGERGVGKTRLVETCVGPIKNRRNVVTVDCGALDSETAESFWFGHVKGAFVGADRSREGVISEADKGVLFLDEVQDLPRTIQRKLLRVFQDPKRRHRRLGESKEKESDVELVCSSSMSLEELRRCLDPDFFNRINRLIVHVPPLRECREDLKDDWCRVWRDALKYMRLPREAPWSKDLENVLGSHPLQGNMWELQSISALLSAQLLSGKSHDDAIRYALKEWNSRDSFRASEFNGFGQGSRKERIRQFCRAMAQWAKAKYGTWTEAASVLGCDEKTLRDDAK